MRVNIPVTNNEKVMQDGEFLVSRTNTKGVITYVNQQFIDISGFTEQELIGQAHNIVRHPDMPPEAFEDFWETLKLGKPWSGVVKNCSKDGSFYWVYANVTPLIEEGKVAGYMSVRSKPTQEQIQAAEALYDEMRNGVAKFNIIRGNLVEKSVIGAIKNRFRLVSIRTRIMLLPLLALMGFVMLGILNYSGLGQDNTLLATSVVGGGILLLMIFAGISLHRTIIRPLSTASDALRKMASGDFTSQIEITNYDEIGNVIEAVKSMQIRAGNDLAESKRMINENQKVIDELNKSKAVINDMAEAKRKADENLRIKNALDQSLSAVMIIDVTGTINYVNGAMHKMLDIGESEIAREIKGFKACNIMGNNINLFSPGKRLIGQAEPLKVEIKLGDRYYVLALVPVTDETGEQIGAAIEWIERTAELRVEQEVSGIVAAASKGIFSDRLLLEGKEGFIKQLAEGINGLMETSFVGLNDVTRVLNALATGDLTKKIENEYEGIFGQLKNDANATVDKLVEIVANIRSGTEAINVASQEIASGNDNLSQRTEEQASALEQTASSMEELTSTVKQNAGNADQANQLAIDTHDKAVKGGSVVDQVVATMSEINSSSKKIVDIISVIDGIAFQTNILALNAAVEAARAGEQGRGFAVVATEVRTLAQRSATAAKQIKELINDSVNKVDKGTELVDQAGKNMSEIVQSVKRVTEIMSEISTASQEQSSGIVEINQAVSQMDEMTQQNAALVEEAAAASEAMIEQSNSLVNTVAIFQLGQEIAQRRSVNPAERRSSNRAVNVDRLNKSFTRDAYKAAVSQSIKTGTDNNGWTEF